jgi:hypothetical protein
MTRLSRRTVLRYAGGALALGLAGLDPARGQSAPPGAITLYNSPT